MKLKYPVIEIFILSSYRILVIRFNIMNQLSSSDMVWLNDELKMQTNNILKLKDMEDDAKEVAVEANANGVHNVESLFAPKGYCKIVRVEDTNKVVIDGARPDGNDLWITLGKVIAFAEVSEMFRVIKKFYKDKLVSDMDIVKSILSKFAFSLDFIEHKKGDKYEVDGEEREVKEDGFHEDWDSFVVGPMNQDVNEMMEKALEFDEEAIKFFFVPREKKVFSFGK